MGFTLDPASRFDKACEAGHTFEPVTPDGAPIGATITVRGPESAAVKAHLKRLIARLQAREADAKRRGRAPDPMTPEENDSEAVDLAVAYTMGWSGFQAADGTPLEFSEATARELYIGWSWIRRQVIDEAQALGNFVKLGASSSSSTLAPSSAST